MAFRRGVGSLSGLVNGLRHLALSDGVAAASTASQHHVLPPLVSLRSFLAPSAQQMGQDCSAGLWALAMGCRRINSGAAAAQQQAAAAQPATPQAAAGEAEEESLEQIRARIFGTHIGNGLRSGRKVLRKALVGQKLVEYYPEDLIKKDPLMLNLKAESAKLKLAQLRRRGKGPPKKGAGKRASKKR